jgi:hypothetical protein
VKSGEGDAQTAAQSVVRTYVEFIENPTMISGSGTKCPSS